MLPTGKRDKSTATQIILYTLWLVVASLLPVLGYTGQLFLSPVAGVLIFLLGLYMLFYATKLYQFKTTAAAKKLIFITDKFIR